jgi:predicted nucleic acid-binding protein
MSVRSFVDTNVLIYAVDDDEIEKRDRAREILAAERAAVELVLSTQVLCEFYVVATRKLARPLAVEDAADAVDELAKLTVIGADPDLVRDGISISRRAQLSLWDGMIVAAAKLGTCERILTEDLADGSTLDGVRIENPFR